MKKYILFFALLSFCFVWSCRSKEIAPNPVVSVENENVLLKSLSVKGATEVKIDNEKEIIQVTLPESYSSEFIDLDFTLAKGGFLNYYDSTEGQKILSNTNNPQKPSYRFMYEGNTPLNINVQKEYGLNSKSYIVYVNHINGKLLRAKLERIDSVSYSLNTDFQVNIISSLGTVPNKHNGKLPYALLRKTGSLNADTSAIYGGQNRYFGGFKLDNYIPFENESFRIELVVNDASIILNENYKFLRQKAVIDASYSNLLAVISKNFDLKGGIFIASNKYSVKLSNDYINESIELKAQVKNANTLNVENNLTIKSGGYLIDIYENEILLYHGVINVGNGGLNSAIRNFIKIDFSPFGTTPPAQASTNKEQFTKGDSLLILPVDMYTAYNRLFTEDELAQKIAPTLQLTKASQVHTVNPIKKNYRWSIAGISVVYFQYTIPKSTELGFYEAQLVYPDGRESLKYWNKIEIK